MKALRHIIAVVLKLALALAITVAILGGFLVLRLENGPLSLDFLSATLEDALSPEGGAFRVRMEGTVLSLAEDRSSIGLLARGIRFESESGAVLASIPDLSLGLSLDALLRGRVAPTRIIVDQPQIHLDRDEDGTFRLGLGGDTGTNRELTEQLVADLMAPPDTGRRLGYLTEVRIRGGSLAVTDRTIGAEWQASRVAASLRRRADGVSGDFTLAVAVADSAAELRGEFGYRTAEHRLAAQLRLAGWDLSKLQRIAPVLAPLAGLQVPLSGSAELTVDTADARVDAASVELTAGPGSLVDPRFSAGTVAMAGGGVSAVYDPAAGRLTLRRLSLDLGGPTLLAKGTVDGIQPGHVLRGIADWGSELTVAVDTTVQRMPADALERDWPPGLAHNAREWITRNIHDGTVEEAHLAASLRIQPALPDADAVTLDRVTGGLAMKGLTIHYLRPLPPVRNVDGTAVFDKSTMTLTPTSGALSGIAVGGGTIIITDLDKVDQDIDVALDIKGPLRDALEVLDLKPFQYAHELGIDPSRVGGTAAAHLSIKFPLDHRTTFDQVVIATRAQLADVALGKIVLDQDLSEGDLTLNLDRAGMKVDGKAKLAGMPASLGWQQNFKPRDGVRSRVTVNGQLDEATRRRLGLAVPAVTVTGPLGIDAALSQFADRSGTATIAIAADGAGLSMPDLNWSKPAGAPASAKLELDLAGDRLAGIRDATVKGAGMDVRLAASFGARDGSLQRAELKRFNLGETDFAGTVARRPEGGWRAELQGPALDATGLFANLGKTGETRKDEPPLAIDGRFQRVILGPKREAKDVALQAFSDGVHWQSISLDASPFAKSALKFRFGETGGKRPFSFSASDLGDALLLFDISDHVTGGHVTASGNAEDSGAQRSFIGKIDGGDYRIVGAPVIAKLLSLASFSGIASLLTGDGIPFSRLSGDFVLRDGKATLRQARTYGGALGINASGTIDLDRSTLDLDGTLVPAYTLNSILGNIPIIGNLLQGGEGQGIFAAGFKAKGPFDDPNISVNPLSAIAPGFLRNLFLFDEGGGDAATSPPVKSEK